MCYVAVMVFREFLSTYDFNDQKPPKEEASEQHIRECQSLRGVEGCGECPFFDSCEVIKAHLRARAGLQEFGVGSDGTKP
jgi:hypothetical protein